MSNDFKYSKETCIMTQKISIQYMNNQVFNFVLISIQYRFSKVEGANYNFDFEGGF
jgi:type IV secretory pathway VirB6-like protein